MELPRGVVSCRIPSGPDQQLSLFYIPEEFTPVSNQGLFLACEKPITVDPLEQRADEARLQRQRAASRVWTLLCLVFLRSSIATRPPEQFGVGPSWNRWRLSVLITQAVRGAAVGWDTMDKGLAAREVGKLLEKHSRDWDPWDQDQPELQRDTNRIKGMEGGREREGEKRRERGKTELPRFKKN